MPSKATPAAPAPAAAGWRAWLACIAGGLAVLAGLTWWLDGDGPTAVQAATAKDSTAAVAPTPTGWPALGQTQSPAMSPDERAKQLAVWTERLERAKHTLASYREGTRYPFESRPISEHADQTYPNRPVAEDSALRTEDGQTDPTINVKTSQSRVFMAAGESVVFTIAASDRSGQPVAFTVTQARALGMPSPGRGGQLPQQAVVFGDAGLQGDARAGDGVQSALLAPAQGPFAQYDGAIRVEVKLKLAGREGLHGFDVYYSPEQPAVWAGPVREVVERGSLYLYMPVQVSTPGRYLVSGRLDDASGKPLALLSFNDVLPAGLQQIKLTVFGKLLRDLKPSFPLTLRDVDGYLLKENTHPDRALLPRLMGTVHVSKAYSLNGFSADEWTSEERDRYLAEYGRDVDLAQGQVDQLTGP
ncbi:hypothetical protein QWZ03_16920 [Chitinimonas viridis]|uniref:Uncharacterized protein n=1 Tax=Chitinimonas viridis TaxID=664880 RepID=A0ABT8B869_9NEIS|nr:hypothetical protein [Chitinimonas viridis]MDN3578454.1 hypothetical protein [Chitinimonas viridis]